MTRNDLPPTPSASKDPGGIAAADYATLTFDCYGTLIDWEAGILGYLQPLLARYDVHVIDEFVLETFAELEPQVQAAGGAYGDVLAQVLGRMGERLAFQPKPRELAGFADSIADWPAFADTVAALRKLADHFELAVLSNIDNALFALSAKRLRAPFAHVITAQDVGAYKPDPRMFERALSQVRHPVLHVAQSRFHDIVPATAAGLDTVWINRPSKGAAKPAKACPTWTFASMADFAAAVC